MSTAKHRHKFSYYSSTSKDIYFKCKCGLTKTRPLTKAEYKLLGWDRLGKPGIHKVYHEYVDTFKNNKGKYKTRNEYHNYDLAEDVRKWARKYPKDVKVITVDDSFHMSSTVVLIDHKEKDSYFGITAIYIPQRGDEGPAEFFLYPQSRDAFIGALAALKKAAEPVVKAEKIKQQKKSQALRKLKP